MICYSKASFLYKDVQNFNIRRDIAFQTIQYWPPRANILNLPFLCRLRILLKYVKAFVVTNASSSLSVEPLTGIMMSHAKQSTHIFHHSKLFNDYAMRFQGTLRNMLHWLLKNLCRKLPGYKIANVYVLPITYWYFKFLLTCTTIYHFVLLKYVILLFIVTIWHCIIIAHILSC